VCSWVAKLLRKRKIILIFRGGKFASYVESHAAYVHQLVARADSLQTPSLFLQEALGKHSIAVQYLPNFVNLEQFTFAPHSSSKHKLLWIRSFASIYQPQLAIEILAKVRSTFPDATLTMVGPDDGLLATCKQLAMKLNIAEHIQFTGPVAHSELAKYYHQHDVYLNTTQYESFGNALMEAASSGIPIVSTSVGEIPYLWKQNESILLVPDGKAISFAAAIQSLWTNDTLRQHVIQQARKQSERFAWDAIQSAWFTLLTPTPNVNS
jgi:glycosyltransferase involved in cell wall biosynthesis